MNFLRRLRRFLAGPAARSAESMSQPWASIWKNQAAVFSQAQIRIHALYACVLYFAVMDLPQWPGWLATQTLDPLWPVVWMKHVSISKGVGWILGLNLAGALCGAFFCRYRWARIFVFLSFFELIAFRYSFGKIGHSWHAWILALAILIFLPRSWDQSVDKASGTSRSVRVHTLGTLWTVQALLLLTYSLSGLGKAAAGVYQACIGERCVLSPDAMSLHIAERLLQTGSTSLWGPWLIGHPWIGWPFFLGAAYLLFFSFCAAFRPATQTLWALGLILFHVGSYFTLTIIFPQNILLLGLILVGAPLGNPNQGSWEWLRQMPGTSTALRIVGALKKKT